MNNWRTTTGGILSAFGKTLQGIGVLSYMSGGSTHQDLLWNFVLFGYILSGLGSAFAGMSAQDALPISPPLGVGKQISPLDRLIIAIVLIPALLVASGCDKTTAAKTTVEQIKASSAASRSAYEKLLDVMVKIVVRDHTALEDARYSAALKSVTQVKKLADGNTINYIDPADQRGLDKQHGLNLTQINNAADAFRAKVRAAGANAETVEQLTDALSAYYAGASTNDATIAASLKQVADLVDQFIPAKSTAPHPKK